MTQNRSDQDRRPALYTPEERVRRDATAWTLVQGILAPLQFLAFAVSLVLVLRYIYTGMGYEAATISIIVKTGFLYVIMITGAIWEKVVFGQYLLAPAFYWEDVFSFGVIALHTAYLVAMYTGALAGADRITSVATSLGARQVCQRAFDLAQVHPVRSAVVTGVPSLAKLVYLLYVMPSTCSEPRVFQPEPAKRTASPALPVTIKVLVLSDMSRT